MEKDLEEKQKQLFQILRFHMQTTIVSFVFDSSNGVPSWNVVVQYRGEKIFYDSGTRLTRRLEKVIRLLTEKFGKGIYEYEKLGDKPY